MSTLDTTVVTRTNPVTAAKGKLLLHVRRGECGADIVNVSSRDDKTVGFYGGGADGMTWSLTFTADEAEAVASALTRCVAFVREAM